MLYGALLNWFLKLWKFTYTFDVHSCYQKLFFQLIHSYSPPLPPPTIFDLEGERKFLRTSLIISSVQNKKVSETTKKEKKKQYHMILSSWCLGTLINTPQELESNSIQNEKKPI